LRDAGAEFAGRREEGVSEAFAHVFLEKSHAARAVSVVVMTSIRIQPVLPRTKVMSDWSKPRT
jgi:hypothetical protein